MGLHEEFDAESQPTRRHVVHLLADAVPEVQPQVLPLAAGELQPKVVHFYDTQLPTYLGGRKRKRCKLQHWPGCVRLCPTAGERDDKERLDGEPLNTDKHFIANVFFV